MSKSEEPWFAKGLHFKCTGCGGCCTGSGRVWLNESEIHTIANALQINVSDFVEQSVIRLEGRWSLKENPKNGDCCFLEKGRCTIYEARPRQCKTFPWWPSTLQSPESWQETKRVCEGIETPEAPLISIDEIRSNLVEEQRGRRQWKR